MAKTIDTVVVAARAAIVEMYLPGVHTHEKHVEIAVIVGFKDGKMFS